MTNPQNNDTPKKSAGPSWLSRLAFFAHPVALGVYLTLFFSALAFYYYVETESKSSDNWLLSLIHDVHQKSIDYRLQLRGPRLGSPDVAVLAFDDRSLNIVGRWPWPRQTINDVFQNATNAGAKIIAADITWSEPSDRPELRLVQKLQTSGLLNQGRQEFLQEELRLLDGDQIFSDGIASYADKIVLGNFFDNELRTTDHHIGYGYTVLCERLVLEQTSAYKMWDSDYALLGDADPNYVYFPSVMADNYRQLLQQIGSDALAESPKNLNSRQKFELSRKIHQAKMDFCRYAFLEPDEDPLYGPLSESWAQVLELDSNLQSASFDEWVQSVKDTSLANRVLQVDSWTTNLQKLYEQAKYHGYFNAVLDRDGTIRRSQLVARSANMYLPSISFKAFLAANEYSAILNIRASTKWPGTKELSHISVSDNEGKELFHIPTRPDGSLYINYAGKQKMFPYVSAADLVDPSQQQITISRKYLRSDGKWDEQTELVDRDTFLKGKYLVAGATAIGVYDLRLTPFEENFPGVETHANILDNLLRQDFLRSHPEEAGAMPIVLLVLGLIMSLALSHLGAVSGLVFTLVSAGIVAFIERTFFFMEGYVTAVVFPTSLVFGSYVFMTFYKYFTEERSKRELRQTFSKYVSPSIVAEILEDPKNLELGGRKEEITIFFSDVRGFTTISEKLDPRALSDLLNDYLTPMTDLVFENRGTLDKYMGDAIMGFFGAPIHYQDHAKYAARCALQQLEKLKELQAKYEAQGLPMIDIGIGLNTGECSVGNMGSQTVRNYTVMGDAVNLASRLEGINKQYGTRTIISEFTEAAIRDDFTCREVDWVRVKGKLLPVKIFEILSEGRPNEILGQMKSHFDDGYAFYHEKRFEDAIRSFEKARAANPDDATSRIYIERCQSYLTSPPPGDWDGVFVMTSK